MSRMDLVNPKVRANGSRRCRATLRVLAISFLTFSAIGPALGQTPLRDRSVVRDPAFRFASPVTSWQEIKNRNVVMQQRDYSCGAAALATLLRYYWGHDIGEETVLAVIESMLSEDQLRERESEGLTMADVADAAIEMGYRATVGKLEYPKLTESKVPLIVVVDLGGTDHFVVVRGIAYDCVYLADPIRGNLRVSAATFRRAWQGNAVLVVAPPGETRSDRSRLKIRSGELVQGYLNRQLIRRAASAGRTSLPAGR